MRKLSINIKEENIYYDIIIGNNILTDCSIISIIKDILRGSRVFIISDNIVASLYLEDFKKELEKFNIQVFSFILSSGESSKSIENVYSIYSSLADCEISRGDLIISFGGGVVGDISGFVSATWMRGIDYIQIPTTLLSMVDSSIGGKTAINIKEGKNLVGAFKSPKLVLMDINTLKSLPIREYNAGMVEIIKHSLLFDYNLFKKIEELYSNNKYIENTDDLENIIKRNCELKGYIVEKDYKEKNDRMLLNFGHTIGHALENVLGYGNILHGEAVAIGIVYAIKLGVELNITKDTNLINRVKTLFNNLNIDTMIPKNINLVNSIKLDKKRQIETINFIFLEEIEKPIIKKINILDFYSLV